MHEETGIPPGTIVAQADVFMLFTGNPGWFGFWIPR